MAVWLASYAMYRFIDGTCTFQAGCKKPSTMTTSLITPYSHALHMCLPQEVFEEDDSVLFVSLHRADE